MEKLTKKQQSVLNFIKMYKTKTSFTPTHKEICQEFGYKSTNSAFKHKQSLIKKGYIKRRDGQYGLIIL